MADGRDALPNRESDEERSCFLFWRIPLVSGDENSPSLPLWAVVAVFGPFLIFPATYFLADLLQKTVYGATPAALMFMTTPAFSGILARRTEAFRKTTKAVFDVLWNGWSFVAISWVFYAAIDPTRQRFETLLADMSPFWLTALFTVFVGTACGRIAVAMAETWHATRKGN